MQLPLLVHCFLLTLAGNADPQQIVHALESRYQHAKTLKAAFFESYREGKGGGVAESGTVYFSRPGRMRWEYQTPESKLFIVDGRNAWFYLPEDKTVSRAKIKESSDWRTPIALLAGNADLGKLCREVQLVRQDDTASQEGKPEAPGDAVLRCLPREDEKESGLQDVLLETNPHAYLVRVVIRQAGDVETEFRFGNWQEDLPVAENQFHFQPPPGVAVVDESALADQIR
jgi:outer membrane lipoprotein carrier protein